MERDANIYISELLSLQVNTFGLNSAHVKSRLGSAKGIEEKCPQCSLVTKLL